jgi:hypothetical protein
VEVAVRLAESAEPGRGDVDGVQLVAAADHRAVDELDDGERHSEDTGVFFERDRPGHRDTAAGQGGDDPVLAADVVCRRGQAAERGTAEDPRVRAVGQ